MEAQQLFEKIINLSEKYLDQKIENDISILQLENIINSVKEKRKEDIKSLVSNSDQDGWSVVNQTNRDDSDYQEIINLYDKYKTGISEKDEKKKFSDISDDGRNNELSFKFKLFLRRNKAKLKKIGFYLLFLFCAFLIFSGVNIYSKLERKKEIKRNYWDAIYFYNQGYSYYALELFNGIDKKNCDYSFDTEINACREKIKKIEFLNKEIIADYHARTLKLKPKIIKLYSILYPDNIKNSAYPVVRFIYGYNRFFTCYIDNGADSKVILRTYYDVTEKRIDTENYYEEEKTTKN